MAELPSGTVTFLFTDIEGSTRLWEEHPEAMRPALARHDEILRMAIEAHDGVVVKTTGDGFHAAFATAGAGALAALDAQVAVAAEPWSETGPLVVRMGLHTGVAELRDGDYYGSVLNRAARLMSVAHGGQVVVSQTVEQLLADALPPEIEIVDLGEHRLRDLAAPMRVFQLSHPELAHEFAPLRSLDIASGNLPVQRSTFVGRSRDLERLRNLVKERRLLTLTGVGGVGKTRLALQAAADAVGAFPGGAWLVELARTGDPGAVASVVVTALGALAQPGRSDTDVVCDHLGATHSILVMDNCEHVLDAAAELTEEILDRCPGVVVLATSREPLDIDGEQIVPVRPLDPTTDAVALFVERAQHTDPAFEFGPDTEVAVHEICGRLDGVPLAVELAAARIDSMPAADIAARLDDRFRLLASGRRRAVDRHQTLRATLEWSHQLLDDDEQMLLRRLGVFAGGFPASAVGAVCSTTQDSFVAEDVLASLVRKSLVQFERDPSPGRYRLLETVRVFALEQLADAGEADAFGRAHAEWIRGLVDHPLDSWYTQGVVDTPAFRREFDNWRDAVNYALSTDDPVLARSLTFHTFGAEIPETARWTEAALEVPGIREVPGAYWLHWAVLARAGAEMEFDTVRAHIAAFHEGRGEARTQSWVAPFEAMLLHVDGQDALEALDPRSFPDLSPVAAADLHMYRAFYGNLPPRRDLEAAESAVRLGEDASCTSLPVALTMLATALSDVDRDASLLTLRRAEELADEGGNRFIVAAVAGWGALALLALPDAIAAKEITARFDQLQSQWNNAAGALLAVCLCVLRRVGDPMTPRLHAFIWAQPGAGANARSVIPDLPPPDPSVDPPASLEEAVALVRAALDTIAAT